MKKDMLVSVFRSIVFVFILGSIVLQPIMQTEVQLEEQEVALIDFALDADSGENESPEEDENKDDKIEPLFSLVSQKKKHPFERNSIFGKQYLLQDFTLEIHIPPPKNS